MKSYNIHMSSMFVWLGQIDQNLSLGILPLPLVERAYATFVKIDFWWIW